MSTTPGHEPCSPELAGDLAFSSQVFWRTVLLKIAYIERYRREAGWLIGRYVDHRWKYSRSTFTGPAFNLRKAIFFSKTVSLALMVGIDDLESND